MVLELWREGKNTRKIATDLEISTQAVNQHLRRLRLDGELEEKAS
jgi:DNA-binding CsgD family transcriptional regulator